MLVAAAVGAVLLVVLLDGFGLCLRNTGTAEDYTQAALLARTVMLDLEKDARLAPGKRAGVFGKEFDRFRWEATVAQPTTEPWFAVDLGVTFSRRGLDRTVTIRTVLPAPGLVDREGQNNDPEAPHPR